MLEHLQELNNWLNSSDKIVLARVIKTWGSSPRPMGSVMLVNGEGKIAGSVSGGCVEGAVVKSSISLLEDHSSHKLDFGVSDEEAWSVGLSCGGSIQVFLQEADFGNEVWSTLKDHLESNKSAILISSLVDGKNTNTLITEDNLVIGDSIPEEVLKEARDAYSNRTHRSVEHNGVEYFIQIFPRKSILLIVGVAHITVDLVRLGNMYDFETIVIDPRGYFAENIEFKELPSQLHQAYPSEVLDSIPLDPYTYCAILSHDPKIDDNALEIILQKDMGYIGALGSKKTHAKRVGRLQAKGISEDLIGKIHAPIGVPINARSAKEIALAIMSEIIQSKNAKLER